MSLFSELVFRLRTLVRGRAAERDLDDELRLHLEQETAKYERRGAPAEEARRRAALALGAVERVKEDCRDTWGTRWLDDTVKDLRYATRQLAANRGFATVAILSLGLGIGANTAVFQLIDAVGLRPLPIERPAEIVQIRLGGGKRGMGIVVGPYQGLTRPIWDEIERDHPAFSRVLAWTQTQVAIGRPTERRRADAILVSGGFFEALGVGAFRGRTLTRADEPASCPAPIVMVSHDYWQRSLGAPALPATLVVDGTPRQIVGVVRPGFYGLAVGEAFDVALPLCPAADTRPDLFSLTVMGRLRDGWTLERASRQLETASPALFAATVPPGYGPDVVDQFKRYTLEAVSASRGVSWLRSTYDRSLWLLLGITALVLLIACANLANLLLARATTREREIAVRLALGASRGRLVRQLLTESAVLAAAGGALGLWLARYLTRALVAAISTDGGTVALATDPDWRVLLFAAATAGATSFVFGLAPARRALRSAPVEAMKAAGRGLAGSRDRASTHRALVVLQVAISLVLLVGALLFVRSFRNLTTFDAGVRQAGVVVTYVQLPDTAGPPERHEAWQAQILDEVSAVPGVVDAATTTNVPLLGTSWTLAIRLGGSEGPSKFTWVSPAYFRTMGMRRIEGRDFDDRDTSRSPRVAIVNEMFVRRFLSGGRAIGRTLATIAEPGYPATEYAIVGIVADTKYNDLRGPSYPMAFAPASQYPRLGASAWLVTHASVPPRAAAEAIERAIAARHAGAITESFDYGARIRDRFLGERLMAMLSGFFGVLAAVLTVIGLYGVISYLVAQRRNEIGVRLALGASPGQVMALVAADAARLVAAGLVVGVGLALVAARTAAAPALLFQLEPHDPLSLAAACLLLAAVAAAATLVPARRASKLNAIAALRHE